MNFKELFNIIQNSTDVGLSDFRNESFARFEERGLPNKSNEAWKYTSIKPLESSSLSLKQIDRNSALNKAVETSQEYRIPCVDGYFDIPSIKSALPKDLEVMSLIEAISSNRIRIPNLNDSFYNLNSSFFENGLFIYLPKGKAVEKTIVLEHKIANLGLFVNPKIHIEMETESSVDIAEIFKSKSSEYLMNSSLSIRVGERASLKILKHFEEEYLSSHVDNNFIEQKSSSAVQYIQLSSGSQLLRQNFEVIVNGSSASTDLRGISILEGQSQMDNFIKVHHRAPESMSRQIFKSVLKDQAHYVFQGNIRIEKEAQKTDSDQQNRNLMLGKKCYVDTKPQLDVFADDVKATHGAAIGQLNPEEKFYLESRAISPDMALQLLCEGFALDLLEGLKSKWALNYLTENMPTQKIRIEK